MSEHLTSIRSRGDNRRQGLQQCQTDPEHSPGLVMLFTSQIQMSSFSLMWKPWEHTADIVALNGHRGCGWSQCLCSLWSQTCPDGLEWPVGGAMQGEWDHHYRLPGGQRVQWVKLKGSDEFIICPEFLFLDGMESGIIFHKYKTQSLRNVRKF
jgi:hypothetical protein